MTSATIADGWRQIDYRRHTVHAARGIILHVPRPDGSNHSLCGSDLRHATAVTPEGAAIGRTCGTCERSAASRR